MSDNLREELQRKAEATLQSLPSNPVLFRFPSVSIKVIKIDTDYFHRGEGVSSILPPQVEEFHSLVPLDTSNQKSAQVFGYPSWVYKAFSNEDGHAWTLRRVEGKLFPDVAPGYESSDGRNVTRTRRLSIVQRSRYQNNSAVEKGSEREHCDNP